MLINKTILIVDDDLDVKESTRFVLEKNGYDVAVACGGKDGVEEYAKSNPDLTFMDIKMPDMDGYDAFFKIHEKDPNAKVVFVTGYTIEDDRYEQAKKYNLIDTLYKPVDFNFLLKFIKEHAWIFPSF